MLSQSPPRGAAMSYAIVCSNRHYWLSLAARLAVMPAQGARLDFADMQAALSHPSAEQHEALPLVAAEGVSYEEAAQICGTNLGTIKSRINRARTRLAELLAISSEEDLGPDSLVKAALVMHSPS